MGMYLLSLRWREIRYAGDEIFSGVRLAPMPLFTLPVHVYWNRMANWQSTSPAKLWEAHLWARCGARHHTWTQTTRTGKFCNWPHDRCCWSEYIGCIQQTPGLLHHHDARTGNASLPANRVMQVRCITSFGLCICPRSLRFLLPPPSSPLRLSRLRECVQYTPKSTQVGRSLPFKQDIEAVCGGGTVRLYYCHRLTGLLGTTGSGWCLQITSFVMSIKHIHVCVELLDLIS